MKLSQIVHEIESWAPPHLAENYDNIGLLVGNPEHEVNGAVVNLDMTEAVIDEAADRGLGMVIAHHPIWFTGRKRLNGEDYVSRAIIKAVKRDVALYAVHTNLDNVQHGVNAKIAEKIGLQNCELLLPKPGEEHAGSGMIGTLPAPLPKKDFLQHIKDTFQSKGIRYADFPGNLIEQVAVCGGAGSFLTGQALRKGADAFVTGDITYHKYFDNENRMLLMDIGHYESEQFTSELICSFLSKKFPNFAVRLSEVYTNPVKYF